MKIVMAMFISGLAFALALNAQETNKVSHIEKDIVLDLNPGDNNPRNSEGDFVQLDDGRLLFVYTHFYGDSSSDFASAYLAGRYSSDGGKTWTVEDTVILPNEGGINSMSVSLLQLDGGKLALFYLRKNSKADCRPYMRTSTDAGKTWSEPVLIIEQLGYFVVNNDRVVQLDSGRLVVPAARHSADGAEFQSRGQALCYLSDDNGQTWRQSESVLDAPEGSRSGLQEPGVVQLADGRLMMLCRTDQGCQMRSWSEDGGKTWTAPELTDLESPVSPATIERMPGSDELLLVWNDHENVAEELKGKRTPLNVAVVAADGKAILREYLLEDKPNGWYCYTAMQFVEDAVLLGYCAGEAPEIAHLSRTRIVRIPLEALGNGRP